MLLGFAGVEYDPEVDRLLQLGGRLLQHGEAAADVKAAHCDRHTSRAELARDGHGARELVGLDADQTDEAGMSGLLDAPCDPLDRNRDVHLIVGVDLDRDVVAQDVPVAAVLGDGVERGHGIRRDPGLPPLNDIAVLIVMGGLHDLDVKGLHRFPDCSRPLTHCAAQKPTTPPQPRCKRKSRQSDAMDLCFRGWRSSIRSTRQQCVLAAVRFPPIATFCWGFGRCLLRAGSCRSPGPGYRSALRPKQASIEAPTERRDGWEAGFRRCAGTPRLPPEAGIDRSPQQNVAMGRAAVSLIGGHRPQGSNRPVPLFAKRISPRSSPAADPSGAATSPASVRACGRDGPRSGRAAPACRDRATDRTLAPGSAGGWPVPSCGPRTTAAPWPPESGAGLRRQRWRLPPPRSVRPGHGRACPPTSPAYPHAGSPTLPRKGRCGAS